MLFNICLTIAFLLLVSIAWKFGKRLTENLQALKLGIELKSFSVSAIKNLRDECMHLRITEEIESLKKYIDGRFEALGELSARNNERIEHTTYGLEKCFEYIDAKSIEIKKYIDEQFDLHITSKPKDKARKKKNETKE